jgi:hypothetical protein
MENHASGRVEPEVAEPGKTQFARWTTRNLLRSSQVVDITSFASIRCIWAEIKDENIPPMVFHFR